MSITPEMIELVNSTIPKQKERTRSFLDLTGIAREEHAFSRLYAYFLDPAEDHGLGDLFLRALLELCESKLNLSNFTVEREVKTKKGNFIDLLISGIEDDEGKSVVIENKVDHQLDNDLKDYWDYAPGTSESKVGVLLTINQHRIPLEVDKLFCNLSHLKWIGAVVESARNIDLNSDQRWMLTSFQNAIINLSNDLTMNDQILFFLNNVKAVNEIVATREKTQLYINSQLDSAAAQLGYTIGGTRSDHYRYFRLPQLEHLYYTIIFDKLLTEQQNIWIVLEVAGEGLKNLDELKRELSSDVALASPKGMEFATNSGSGWQHFLCACYKIDRSSFEGLAQFIVRKINEDFSEITMKAVNVLKSEAV